MSFFAKLPEILSVEVLLLWLDLDHVGKIDIAFCCNKEREIILNILQTNEFVVDLNQYSNRKLTWMALRNVKLGDMEFAFSKSSEEFKMAPNVTSKLTKLHLTSKYPLESMEIGADIIVNFLNTCPKLMQLEISSLPWFNEKVIELIDPNILQQITSFKCDTDNFVPAIADYFTNLTSIEICLLHCDECRDKEIISLIQQPHNRKLQHISMTNFKNQTELMEIVGAHCPDLTTLLCSSNTNEVNLAQLTKLLQQCPKLELYKNLTNADDHITYSYNHDMKEFIFSMHGSTLTNLQEFLENNVNFDSIVLHNLTSNFITGTRFYETIANNSPNLSKLTLINCNILYFTAKKLTQCCKNLQKLIIIGDLQRLTADTIVDLFHPGNIINEIQLEFNNTLSIEQVLSIIQKCPNLYKFQLIECKNINSIEQDMLIGMYGNRIEFTFNKF